MIFLWAAAIVAILMAIDMLLLHTFCTNLQWECPTWARHIPGGVILLAVTRWKSK